MIKVEGSRQTNRLPATCESASRKNDDESTKLVGPLVASLRSQFPLKVVLRLPGYVCFVDRHLTQ